MIIKGIRYFFARYLIDRMSNKKQILNESTAIKWNHLQGIILTRGKIKFDIDKLRGKKVLKCKRCLVKIKDGSHCEECGIILTRGKIKFDIDKWC
jgi:hypothetical protein|tara:strand:- start:917 stop:1201 length:285 start_codon:yes stop_codon:yes gene_type:complete